MAPERKRNPILALIFSVSFLDFLAFSMVIPLFPLLILDHDALLIQNASTKWRYLILGLLYAAYPMAQVLFAPVLGKLSDRYGRKTVLYTSYFGNAICYSLFSLGIALSSVIPFFIGNLLAGCIGANIQTINALIADHTSDNTRTRFFGISNMLQGLGFALGPFLSATLVQKFGQTRELYACLFMACCLLSATNCLIIKFLFPPSENKKGADEGPVFEFFLRRFRSYRAELKIVLFGIFLIIFGWQAFIKTFQVFLIQCLQLPDVMVLRTISYYGMCSLFSQFIFIAAFYRWINSKRLLNSLILFLSFSILCLLFNKAHAYTLVIVTLFSFGYAMLNPSLTYVFSKLLKKEEHGHMMGIHQSVLSLAKITAPLFASFAMMINTRFAIFISAFAIAASSLVFILYRKVISFSEPKD